MICNKHHIEHTEKFPCSEYERYRQLSGGARSVTAYETREIESPDGEWLGVEQVELGTYEAGYVGPASPPRDNERDEDA
jgi:hypothetical protein